MEQKGNIYYLNIPNTPKIRCEKNQPDFDKICYKVYYNDVAVITINQKTVIWDSYLYFNISASFVEEALAKNAESAEKNEEMCKTSKSTESQKKLDPTIESIKNELKQILVDIRLLQRICEIADYDWLRPRKYAHLSLKEAQNEQRNLIPRMKELNRKLSDADAKEVIDAAETEVRNLGLAFSK